VLDLVFILAVLAGIVLLALVGRAVGKL